MNTYKFKGYKGITDLQGEYAFIGSAQGDTFGSNNISDNNDWMRFVFSGVDPTNQEAINAEVERRKAANEKYITELKEKGEYGEEYTVTMHVKPNPIFDAPSNPSFPLESYKLVFINQPE